MKIKKNPRIVVLGGGTGSFTVLSGLKNHTSHITALVSMADDGGSTGLLRDELGVLPPGDVRQCLVALSGAPHLRDLFNYRFPGDGSLGGHTFGNLFLSAVEKMSDNFAQGVAMASEVLQIRGKVVPITLDECRLVYKPKEGKRVHGETKIDQTDMSDDFAPELYYKTPVSINPEAKAAIMQAGLIVIAPGSLYTSLIPLLLVDGVAEALQATKAKIAYVMNLVNKPMETPGYAVDDYVKEIERYTGAGAIDVVLYNEDVADETLITKYAHDQEYPVIINKAQFKKARYKAIPGHFLSRKVVKVDPNDKIGAERSFIRHDPEAVAKAIMRLVRY